MNTTAKIDKYSSVREQLGYTSVWSMFHVDDLNSVAYNKHIARLFYSDPLEGKYGMVSVEINKNNPTWLDIWKVCEEAIITLGTHHIFIEEIIETNGVLYLYTGS